MKTKVLLGLSIGYLLACIGCKKDSAAPQAINKQTPKLTINVPTTMNVGSTSTALVTSSAGKVGGVIGYVIQAGSGSATVNPTSGLVTGISTGTVTLVVNSAGDANYNAATASQLITIVAASSKLEQNLTISSIATMTEGEDLQVDILGNAGKLTYAITDIDGSATVDVGGKITAVSAGKVILTVKAAESGNYQETIKTQEITIEVKDMIVPVIASDLVTDDLEVTFSGFNANIPSLTVTKSLVNTATYVVIIDDAQYRAQAATLYNDCIDENTKKYKNLTKDAKNAAKGLKDAVKHGTEVYYFGSGDDVSKLTTIGAKEVKGSDKKNPVDATTLKRQYRIAVFAMKGGFTVPSKTPTITNFMNDNAAHILGQKFIDLEK